MKKVSLIAIAIVAFSYIGPVRSSDPGDIEIRRYRISKQGKEPIIPFIIHGFCDPESDHISTNARAAAFEIPLNFDNKRVVGVSFPDVKGIITPGQSQTAVVSVTNDTHSYDKTYYTFGMETPGVPSHTIDVKIPDHLTNKAYVLFQLPNAIWTFPDPQSLRGLLFNSIDVKLKPINTSSSIPSNSSSRCNIPLQPALFDLLAASKTSPAPKPFVIPSYNSPAAMTTTSSSSPASTTTGTSVPRPFVIPSYHSPAAMTTTSSSSPASTTTGTSAPRPFVIPPYDSPASMTTIITSSSTTPSLTGIKKD